MIQAGSVNDQSVFGYGFTPEDKDIIYLGDGNDYDFHFELFSAKLYYREMPHPKKLISLPRLKDTLDGMKNIYLHETPSQDDIANLFK